MLDRGTGVGTAGGIAGWDVEPGRQVVTVVRKGSRALRPVVGQSPDAFVWLRLYQQQIAHASVAAGADDPLWWTNRKPLRPLTYHAARAMFARANAVLGAGVPCMICGIRQPTGSRGIR